MNEEILLRQNENDEFELYESYAILYINTEEEFNELKEAVKKQKSKKLNKTKWHGVMLNYCPECGKGISSEDIIYCNHCGQKIDWTGVEE